MMNGLFATQRSGGSGVFAAQYVETIVNLVAAACIQASSSSAGAVTATPAASTINLVGSACTQSATSSTGSVTVTPAPKAVNLVGSPCAQPAQSTSAAVTVTPVAQPSPTSAPVARTAKFVGRSRVVIFSGNKPASYQKGPLDELYIVGDFSKDLFEASTTIVSITPVTSGVAVLEGPILQNGFGVVKVGAFDMSAPIWSFTFRLTLANGEQIDRTVEFSVPNNLEISFGKDPDDKRFYSLDFGADATFGGTSLQSLESPVIVGLSAMSEPAMQGNLVTVMIGALATATGALNSYGLMAMFENTEKIFRTISFKVEEH